MNSKKMNLLPIAYIQQYEVDTNAFLRRALLGLFIVGFVLFLFLGKYQLYALEQEVESLDFQHSQLMERNVAIKAINQELEKLEAQWKEFDSLGVQTIPMNVFLEDITKSTPSDVWYTMIELSRDAADADIFLDANDSQNDLNQGSMHFNINGYSQSINSVGNVAYLLNQFSYMNEVTIDYSTEITVDDVSIIEFYIKGQITR